MSVSMLNPRSSRSAVIVSMSADAGTSSTGKSIPGSAVSSGKRSRTLSRRADWSVMGVLASATEPERFLRDLPVELEDAGHEDLGGGRAARDVHVDRHDLIDALEDRVVVEHPA